MKVKKRDGRLEDVSFDKVLNRLKYLINEFNLDIDAGFIAQKVCGQIYDGVKTSDLDEFAAKLCISLITENSEYGILASTIIISNNHKNTSPSFSEVVSELYNNYDINDNHSPIIDEKLFKIVKRHHKKINNSIKYQRDYLFDYFGYKTLERSYLLKKNNEILERPQHLWMRVALGIHGRDIKAAIETYNMMSQKYFTHASPTLFNAGTPHNQLSSCFLLGTHDSVDGIFKTISDCGHISKYAGGLGIHISNIRSKGSRIRGTNGISDGVIPMLKVYNETCRYINQSGRRKGSFAMYLEPWHADFEDFLDIRKNHGDENMRARDLFTAVWMCDIFMKRVEKDQMWSLMCPDECPNLTTSYGKDFEDLYISYEQNNKYRKQVKARDLWFKILTSQIETGTPYILYKDSINSKNNQANLGVIQSSNLCAEICIYSDQYQYGVCNLASIAVNMFVTEDNKYDFEKLKNISKIVCKNLNKIIDFNFYPTPETKKSNYENRPIGIGIQGLADTFIKLRLPYESEEALNINKQIAETIYYGALEASCEVAKEKGTYKTYNGSPLSQGKFQWELWNDKPTDLWDWELLRNNINQYGVRNSLTTAYMPTASTSQILGNNECFEAMTSNIYVRRTLAGEFVVINKYLMEDLVKLGLWNREIKDEIIANRGSIQNIQNIPDNIKELYKIVWEISQKSVINLARARAPFIDQTQSMNLFVAEPNFKNLSSMHFYSWKQGLKTGIYYLRTRPKVIAQQFTIDPNLKNKDKELEKAKLMCSLTNKEACTMCSS
jgi:ribonucleoside-diphosphate reductase alpha subunit